MLDPESKSRWLTDAYKRKYLLNKASLIDLFTIAELPVVESSTTVSSRNIGDIIPLEEYNYTGYKFIEVTESYNLSSVNSPTANIEIVLTKSLAESYEPDTVYTVLGSSSTVIGTYNLKDVHTYSTIREHPNLDKLSSADKYEIAKLGNYQVLTLTSVSPIDQYRGYDLFTDNSYVYGIDYATKDHPTRYIVLSKYGEPPYKIYDTLTLHQNEIDNYTSEGTITTTYGRYLANLYTLAIPFGSSIEYQNKELSISGLEKIIGSKIRNKELTTEQGGTYLDNLFFIGSFGEMAIPGLSKKSLVTSPKVKQRKKELLEKYKDRLDDPVVLSQIEDELISLDKEYLKDDTSMGFYGDSGKKFNVHRKKMYVMSGLTEDFTKEKGKYEFIKESLSEGWNTDSFVAICNEIRRGSYSRGIETANGGAQSKMLMRIVQNLRITGDDCGTTRYLEIPLSESIISRYHGRYVVDPDTNKLVILDKSNQSKFVNKVVKLRSFMYCKQEDGFCGKCAGTYLTNIDQKVIGVLALEMTSAFLTNSLKSMHSSKVKSSSVKKLNKFII